MDAKSWKIGGAPSSLLFARLAVGTALALVFATSIACADVLVRYDISTEDGATDLDPSIVRARLSATPLSRAGGLTPNSEIAIASAAQGNPNFAFVSTDWPADAFGAQRMEVTITPEAEYAISFESVKYAFGGFPQMTYRIATSLDNFATSVGGPYTVLAGDVRESNDSLLILPPQVSPITFRWYSFRDSTVDPVSGFLYAGFFDGNTPQPIIFFGTVQRVPEPGIVSLALAGLTVLTVRRRRKNLSQAAVQFQFESRQNTSRIAVNSSRTLSG